MAMECFDDGPQGALIFIQVYDLQLASFDQLSHRTRVQTHKGMRPHTRPELERGQAYPPKTPGQGQIAGDFIKGASLRGWSVLQAVQRGLPGRTRSTSLGNPLMRGPRGLLLGWSVLQAVQSRLPG